MFIRGHCASNSIRHQCYLDHSGSKPILGFTTFSAHCLRFKAEQLQYICKFKASGHAIWWILWEWTTVRHSKTVFLLYIYFLKYWSHVYVRIYIKQFIYIRLNYKHTHQTGHDITKNYQQRLLWPSGKRPF